MQEETHEVNERINQNTSGGTGLGQRPSDCDWCSQFHGLQPELKHGSEESKVKLRAERLFGSSDIRSWSEAIARKQDLNRTEL